MGRVVIFIKLAVIVTLLTFFLNPVVERVLFMIDNI